MKTTYARKYLSFTIDYATSHEFATDLPNWLAKGFTFSQSSVERRPMRPTDPITVSYQRDDAATLADAGVAP